MSISLNTLTVADIPRVRRLLAEYKTLDGHEAKMSWLAGLPWPDRDFLVSYALAALDTAVNVAWSRLCLRHGQIRHTAEEINLDGGI